MAVLAAHGAGAAGAAAVIDVLGEQVRQRSGLREQECGERFSDVAGRV
jgi:hypothetical protein